MTDAQDGAVVRVRVCAVLLEGGRVCLIRRERPDGVQYSLPGGVVEAGEEPAVALLRELREELGLEVAEMGRAPVLRWVQHQVSSRPGAAVPFRREHRVFVLRLPDGAAEGLAPVELGVPDRAPVVWEEIGRAAGLHLYPAVGSGLHLAERGSGVGPEELPPMTDDTFRWL
ncbi:NUDIX hydrolase [Kitasatospora sp. NPDC051853]|uniref:NUDIX hydrolase n=1 Tax=Kitasatospora sp. NPDC051853 TaxID=3364058 RepID=UPI003797B6E0